MTKKRLEDLKLRDSVISKWKDRIAKSSLTYSELAKRANISRATIWHVLKGNRIPNSSTINAIEDILKEAGV